MDQKKTILTRNTNTRFLLCGLLSVVASCVTSADASDSRYAVRQSKRPALLVNIIVEGLDGQYLGLLQDSFEHDGFGRLMSSAAYADDIDFGYVSNPASSAAMLMTGTGAAVNGIPAQLVYDAATGKLTDIFTDESVMGNFTQTSVSPKAINVSTLSDEIRIDGAGIARVAAFAPDHSLALLMAGHAGNTAAWIDSKSGKWATTTWYKETPREISSRNYKQPLTSRLDTARWIPAAKTLQLPWLPESKSKYPFTYTYPSKDADRVEAFKYSPLVNTEITDVAIEYLKSMTPTQGKGINVLNIGYQLSQYPYARTADTRTETADAYIRLDADLSRLFKAADEAAAGGSKVIMLSGIPATTPYRRDDEQWRIPWGKFSPQKAMGLLNMYLMAVHGNGEWVKGYNDKQFYLNRKLAKDKNLDIADLRDEAASFLSQMSGVVKAETLDEALSKDAAGNINTTYAGDILITVNPGWEIESATNGSIRTANSGVERIANVQMPFYILAPELGNVKIGNTIDARAIAPSVCRLLRIRSPGGASLSPVF